MFVNLLKNEKEMILSPRRCEKHAKCKCYFITTICLRLSGEYLPRLLGEYSPMQPRSQGLSSYRPLGRAKMRDPGNEVVTNVH